MTARRIEVWHRTATGDWWWWCPCDKPVTFGRCATWREALDAGLAHLAEHHAAWFPTTGGYCRQHGVSRSCCGCASADDLCPSCGAVRAVCGCAERSQTGVGVNQALGDPDALKTSLRRADDGPVAYLGPVEAARSAVEANTSQSGVRQGSPPQTGLRSPHTDFVHAHTTSRGDC